MPAPGRKALIDMTALGAVAERTSWKLQMRPFSGILIAWCVCFAVPAAQAADEPVFEIELKDGVITPSRLEVPAKTRFKIIVKNTGKIPAEFESAELRKEVVVPAGNTATMIIRTLDAGEYKFFDDFQIGAPPAVLIAK
jgi:Cupredoxin-like domain